MILFPAIDIRNGKCVRLTQGDYEKESIYLDSPLDAAKQWERENAAYLHIVDLDAAKTGSNINREIIQSIVNHVQIPVQVGGGIRSLPVIADYISMGVSRVIVGTAAIQDPDFLQAAVQEYGDKIAVSIDCRNGYVLTNGWTETSKIQAGKLVNKLEQTGVQTIIYTDVLKDGMLSGPNFSELQAINAGTSIRVIASGGVTTKEDVAKLTSLHLYGAIIGKALYDGTVTFQTLLEGV